MASKGLFLPKNKGYGEMGSDVIFPSGGGGGAYFFTHCHGITKAVTYKGLTGYYLYYYHHYHYNDEYY